MVREVNVTPLMTVQEAADYMRCHRMTMYRALQTGQVPGTRQGPYEGAEWRIEPEKLAALLWQVPFPHPNEKPYKVRGPRPRKRRKAKKGCSISGDGLVSNLP